MPESGSLPVIFIGGAGRSGSTLLGSILGQSPDCFAAGEVTHLWERGLLKDELCGCGRAFSRCEFWQEVIRDAFGSLTLSEVREIERNRRLCSALGTLPLWLCPHLPRSGLVEALGFYEPRLLQLYRSMAKISGKAVVVDSSKFPPESLLLENSQAIELKLLHLVRNCKAVVNAWLKKKRRPEVTQRADFFRVYHPLVTCSAWLIFNTIFTDQSQRLSNRATALRYEDLIESPQRVIRDLAQSLAFREPEELWIDDKVLAPLSNHMVSGNPSRLNQSAIPLVLDREWENSLPWRYRLLVEVLAGRVQKRYGY